MTGNELSFDEFSLIAERIGVQPDLWSDLYPMVRDLRALARHVNELTPELHLEIPLESLQTEAGD